MLIILQPPVQMSVSSVRIPFLYLKWENPSGLSGQKHDSQAPFTVTTSNSCTKCVGSPSIIHDRTSDCNPVSWSWMYVNDLTTKRNFDSQATCVIDVLGLFSDMLSMGVWTTRHWQTSGWLRAWIKCLYCSLPCFLIYRFRIRIAFSPIVMCCLKVKWEYILCNYSLIS